jgi:hypothetical protein
LFENFTLNQTALVQINVLQNGHLTKCTYRQKHHFAFLYANAHYPAKQNCALHWVKNPQSTADTHGNVNPNRHPGWQALYFAI